MNKTFYGQEFTGGRGAGVGGWRVGMVKGGGEDGENGMVTVGEREFKREYLAFFQVFLSFGLTSTTTDPGSLVRLLVFLSTFVFRCGRTHLCNLPFPQHLSSHFVTPSCILVLDILEVINWKCNFPMNSHAR